MRHRASSSIAETSHSLSVSSNPSPPATSGELEMEYESPAPPHARVASASRSRTRGKSPARAVARKEFIAGIGLLLCVVVLWTGSNFVTQARVLYDLQRVA